MIPLVIVRPEPGASTTLAAALALGLDARSFPIFAIEPVAWAPVPREHVDAILLGSANAVRHAGPALEDLRGLPAYCVGEATAVAAQAAGFAVAAIGVGGLQQVLNALAPAHRCLLRLAGVSHVPLALPTGVTMETRTVYAATPLGLSENLLQAVQIPTVVMLHSGEAASHFDAICAKARVVRSRIALAAIGPRVAPLCGMGWASIEIAGQPSDAGLLALAREMCQDAAGAPKSPAERPDAGR